MIVDGASNSSTTENGLDKLVLTKGFGEIVLLLKSVSRINVGVASTYIHLRCKTFLAIANHCVRRECNDWCRRDTVLTFPFTNLSRSLKTTLHHVSYDSLTVVIQLTMTGICTSISTQS